MAWTSVSRFIEPPSPSAAPRRRWISAKPMIGPVRQSSVIFSRPKQAIRAGSIRGAMTAGSGRDPRGTARVAVAKSTDGMPNPLH
jgi:hypothetical protein